MTTMPATPELDKQSEIIHSGRAGTVQEFYDWLIEQGYVLAKYRTEITDFCPGVRRDPFWDDCNCQDGKVIRDAINVGGGKVKKVKAGQKCPTCKGTGEIVQTLSEPRLEPQYIQPEQLMADHFGIDRDKIEAERRALLEALSAATS